MPRDSTSRASRAASSGEKWKQPGREAISRRSPFPGATNIGYTRRSGVTRVSRTIARRRSVVRSRRGR